MEDTTVAVTVVCVVPTGIVITVVDSFTDELVLLLRAVEVLVPEIEVGMMTVLMDEVVVGALDEVCCCEIVEV